MLLGNPHLLLVGVTVIHLVYLLHCKKPHGNLRLLQKVVLVVRKEAGSSRDFSASFRVTAALPVLLHVVNVIVPSGKVCKMKFLATSGNERCHLYLPPVVKFSTQACI